MRQAPGTLRQILSIGLFLATLTLNLSAQDATPSDLRVDLRTATGATRFQVGEVIPIEVAYSSTTPNRYLEPCELFIIRTFGYPQCRFFSRWTFEVTPMDEVVDFEKDPELMTHSGPTFEVPSHDLTQQPSVFSYPLTDRFRFDKPGEYRLRFSTQVGIDDETTQLVPQQNTTQHSVPIVRELIIHIDSADPTWEKSVIEEGVPAFSTAALRDAREPEFQKQENARRALCTLGSPEALRAMARLMASDPPQYVRVCHLGATGRDECWERESPVYLQTCIRHSRDTSPAIDEMQKLLVAPDVAVKVNFFNSLVILLGENGVRRSLPILDAPIVDSERDKLFEALPKKQGAAFIPSLVTVLSSPPRTRNSQAEFSYETTFSPEVIRVIAAHFDELPDDTRQRLLTYDWVRVRSPLMLPVVRRMAEAADGKALLRWLELDPQNASAFIRQEIVRPAPRFSSYYLRLPETELPAEEQKITDNFLALVTQYSQPYGSEYTLTRSAALLHRYATAKILTKVLPAIDGNLLKWHCTVQFPVLAYLLKVSPKDAAPRVAGALAAVNHGECNTNTFLTSIGFLQPSPILERLALQQVELGKSPLARNGADYLRRYASSKAKPEVWKQLVRWSKFLKASGLEARRRTGNITPEENNQYYLWSDLIEAYVAAQAWILTPSEEEAVRKLIGQEQSDSTACHFHCGDQLSVFAHKSQFAIYSRANDASNHVAAPLEYLNSPERLRYSVSQYSCANMKSLQEKLLQFPAGSEFTFAYEFTPRDREEIVEISDFLRQHGYKVANPWHWPFLPADPPRK